MAGYAHSCALGPTGTITCWGDNTFGQLDAPAGSFVEIAAGANFTLARAADGTVVAWGDGAAGQTTVPASVQPAPEPVPTPTPRFTG